eukprot:gnl/TRDRNA2_/TRDRNA2_120783_c1_seq1.p1 gnl/TRDRNA2_/TRDRNA2_120783_c1~~gnl/TRDRNA2_/TRDRNA2_120783_c1_seq1.p1  ORF type:complete len:110 (+),score=1.25 gnl/TRDRNA2_/TRDRNA2_120783_c1_seq1:126-455(+)
MLHSPSELRARDTTHTMFLPPPLTGNNTGAFHRPLQACSAPPARILSLSMTPFGHVSNITYIQCLAEAPLRLHRLCRENAHHESDRFHSRREQIRRRPRGSEAREVPSS